MSVEIQSLNKEELKDFLLFKDNWKQIDNINNTFSELTEDLQRQTWQSVCKHLQNQFGAMYSIPSNETALLDTKDEEGNDKFTNIRIRLVDYKQSYIIPSIGENGLICYGLFCETESFAEVYDELKEKIADWEQAESIGKMTIVLKSNSVLNLKEMHSNDFSYVLSAENREEFAASVTNEIADIAEKLKKPPQENQGWFAKVVNFFKSFSSPAKQAA